MAQKNPFLKTGARLQSEGLLFVRETGNAGAVFAAETRDASIGFAQQLTAASTKLVTSTTSSAAGLRQAVQQEVVGLSRYSLGTVIDFVAELEESRGEAEPLLGVLYTAEIEARVLEAVGELLSALQAQIEKLDAAAPAKKKSSKSTKTNKAGSAPLRNYDQLTARDVVDRIQRLSGPRASEVLRYEKSRKNRATVVRAAKQRVGA